MLADWMVTGDPGVDTTTIDFRRFDQKHLTRTVSISAASENYDTLYDVAHPRTHRLVLRKFSTTPYYLRQEAEGAVFGCTRLWERPLWYASSSPQSGEFRDEWCSFVWSPAVTVEARRTLQAAGLFDRGSGSVFEVAGRDALAHLSVLADRSVDLPVGTRVSVRPPSPAGGIAADLTVVRTTEHAFTVIATAAEDRWLLQAGAKGDVQVTDVSSATSAVAVLGPYARDILTSLVRGNLPAESDTVSAPLLDVAGVPARAVADCDTGAGGWTLYFSAEHGLYLWDQLVAAGANRGLGLGRRRRLRRVAPHPWRSLVRGRLRPAGQPGGGRPRQG